ncbi:hypothetical protein V527_23320 [Pseudomonas aeruginosa VRFPA06]|nr:hypothetical protein V527_23320 [Pseudomonas aeruginosa VRFPA06]
MVLTAGGKVLHCWNFTFIRSVTLIILAVKRDSPSSSVSTGMSWANAWKVAVFAPFKPRAGRIFFARGFSNVQSLNAGFIVLADIEAIANRYT